ncbi:hypothetical protein JOF59_002862 [Streptomyces clavifer]|uniref:Uncharacterized protein n=1 Tax=Streptomyces clavifer TaxID=68188 RepID=A0ABS4V988_9ACTN|nr:hypothetical protein [Streptomyces clavifer]
MTTTETEITEDLVRDLLREQHPDLADRPVKLGVRGPWCSWPRTPDRGTPRPGVRMFRTRT